MLLHVERQQLPGPGALREGLLNTVERRERLAEAAHPASSTQTLPCVCMCTQTDSRGWPLTSTGSEGRERRRAGAHCAVRAVFLPTTKPEPYFPGVALDIDGHGLRGLQPSECPCVTVQP